MFSCLLVYKFQWAVCKLYTQLTNNITNRKSIISCNTRHGESIDFVPRLSKYCELAANQKSVTK